MCSLKKVIYTFLFSIGNGICLEFLEADSIWELSVFFGRFFTVEI